MGTRSKRLQRLSSPPGKKPLRFLRLPLVEERTGLRHTQIHKLETQGKFPKRVKISERASGWVEHEIDQFLEARIAASRTPPNLPKSEHQAASGRNP